MKKTLLPLLVVACISATALAQGPTLTSSTTTPVVGETFLNQFAQATNVSVYSGGANATWDYSHLVDSAGTQLLQVVLPSSTPFNDSFPSSNLVVKTANDSNFIYFNSQASLVSILGAITRDSGSIRYTKPRSFIAYPFSYNSFYTDSVVEYISRANVTGRGKDSLTADGYGTLLLPGKTYTNVLRVRSIENVTITKDSSVSLGAITIPVTIIINTRTVAYLYVVPGTHYPLLTVQNTTTTISSSFLPGLGQSNTIETVTYLKSSSTLPVTFASFKASLQNKNVLLQWRTAQETNTHHFNIQRSLTGIDFVTVDAVAATGNGTGSTYIYNDEIFAKTNVPPSVYYRIQEVDKDGRLFYSGIALVHGSQSIVSLYPNPAGNFIRFSVPNTTVADAVVIYDAKGRAVKQWNHYTLTQPAAIDGLSKGTYFIQIKVANKTTTSTFIKE